MNIWFFVAALALSVVCSAYAKRRGRNGGTWFAIAVVASPLVAAVLLLILENKNPNPSSNKDLAIATMLIVGAFVYLGAFSESGGAPKGRVAAAVDQDAVGAAPSPGTDQRFTITELSLASGEYGMTNISGMLTNNTDKQYSYVQVEFNAYDKSGAQIGSDIVNVNNLEPHGHWKFKTPVLQQDADTIKIKGVTAF